MTEDDLLRNLSGGDPAGSGGGYEWGEEPDLTSLSEEELKARLGALAEEEREISYRRRVIQGRIDLIRSELVRRGGVALTPDQLAQVLLGRNLEAPEGGPGEGSGEGAS